MEDINNMTMKDYYGLCEYLELREKMRDNKPIPLKESQREMIKRTKLKEKEK